MSWSFAEIDAALRQLGSPGEQLLRMRFGIGRQRPDEATVRELLSLSHSRTQQLEARALSQLRANATSEPPKRKATRTRRARGHRHAS